MNVCKRLLEWLGKIIAQELTKPLDEIKRAQREQGEAIADLQRKVDGISKENEIAKECDLSYMDERLCWLISSCLKKGYTTATQRRTVTRMHDAYRARGGNHGEEFEYQKFCALQDEAEYERSHSHED